MRRRRIRKLAWEIKKDIGVREIDTHGQTVTETDRWFLYVTNFHFALSGQKLNKELGWESFQKRIDFLGLSLFQKIHLHQTRPLIRSIMQPREDTNTRSSGDYHKFKYKTVKYSKTYFPYFTDKWNNLHRKMKIMNMTDFKANFKTQIKPHKYKHFNRGHIHTCTLLTKIRLGQSDLKTHLFKVGLADATDCPCGHKFETPEHFILTCPCYVEERLTLYDRITQFIPNFKRLPQKRQFEILIFGYQPKDPDLVKINTQIMKFTQMFLLHTKRFIP